MSAAGAPSALRAALGYRKFRPGRAPRVLVMRASYHLVDDLLDAARELGWQVAALPTASVGRGEGSFLTRLLQTLVEFEPDFLVSINHLGFDEAGGLAELLERFDVPLASWFVDHPLPILGGAEGNARKNCQLFCFERTALPWLVRIGFEEPLHLPTGSNAGRFHPRAVDARVAARFEQPLTLVAGSWWHKARVEPDAQVRAAAAALRERHAVDRAFVRDGLEQALETPGGTPGRLRFHAAQAALAESSMQTRRAFVQALAPLSPIVHGDEHWRELVPGLHLEPPVEGRRELPALFARSAVNLNVTAEQMPTAVNQRVWDVPGVGGFLLTDAQEDVLANFEDGLDVATYADPAEALEKARFYLARPDLRARIAARAHARIEREHRTSQRLRTIEDVMRRRFG